MRKLVVVLMLVILPLVSLSAAAGTYWAHQHSGTDHKHAGHHSHAHQSSPTGSQCGHSPFHDHKGSWDCPSHYVAAMSMAPSGSATPPVIISQYRILPSPLVFFRSIHLSVPQHRDKAGLV